MRNNLSVSLIITTYNWSEALDLVLKSAINQTINPNEIIIADDGSDYNTKKVIEFYQNNTDITIIHSWQEDIGFRAAKSRNKATSRSKYDYIISIDGDMILDNRFIENHLKHAKNSCFIQGSRVLVDRNLTFKLLKNYNNLKLNFFSDGLKNRKNAIFFNIPTLLFKKLSKNNLKGIRTCNMSFFKQDFIKVNGFNEDFIGWGREDSEFVVRLYNNGIKRINLKFSAIAYHLYHNENSRISLDKNDKILNDTIKNKIKFCNNGVDKYI